MLPILDIDSIFDFQKTGNFDIVNNFPYISAKDTVLTWSFSKFKGSSITEYKAYKIDVHAGKVIITDEIDLFGFLAINENLSTTDNSIYTQEANDLLPSNLEKGYYYLYLTDGDFEVKSEIFCVLDINDFDGVVCSGFNASNVLESENGYTFSSVVNITRVDVLKTEKTISGVVRVSYSKNDVVIYDTKLFKILAGEASVTVNLTNTWAGYFAGGVWTANLLSPCTTTDTFTVSNIIATMVFGKVGSNFTASITYTTNVNDLLINWGDGTASESVTQSVAKTHNYANLGYYVAKLYSSSSKITVCTIGNSSFLQTINFHILSEFSSLNLSSIDAASGVLTQITFADANNTLVGNLNITHQKLLQYLYLQSVTINGGSFTLAGTLTAFKRFYFKNTYNYVTGDIGFTNTSVNLTDLDFTYVYLNIGVFSLYSGKTLVFSTYNNLISTSFSLTTSVAFVNLDLSNVTFSNSNFSVTCPSLINFTQAKKGSILQRFSFNASKVVNLNINNILLNINSIIQISANSLLRTIQFSALNNTVLAGSTVDIRQTIVY